MFSEDFEKLKESAGTGLDLSPGCPNCAWAVTEIERLLRGEFTYDEIMDICHNLHGTVTAEEFAEGCALQQRALYGYAPTTDALNVATTELRLKDDTYNFRIRDLTERLKRATARDRIAKIQYRELQESNAKLQSDIDQLKIDLEAK